MSRIYRTGQLAVGSLNLQPSHFLICASPDTLGQSLVRGVPLSPTFGTRPQRMGFGESYV